MNSKVFRLVMFFCAIGLASIPATSWGHGVIGQRFFPESLVVLDPFPADEMDLLAFSHIKDENNKTSTFGTGISKRLSPNLSLGIDAAYDDIRPNDGSPSLHGFENVELEVKYAMHRVPQHEFLATAVLGWEIGGSGQTEIGREPHSAITPQLVFGYGLGDLPDGLKYLRPFGITGQVGLTSSVGNRSTNADEIANTLSYGLVVEYSFLYLQSFVKDVGIMWPFNRLLPVVEFNFEKPFNGPNEGQTIAFANPGFIWAGRYYELGLEAAVPLNDRTGHVTGVQALIHLFLDDIFPNTYTWTPFGGVLGPTQK